MPLTEEQKAALVTLSAADPKEVADALQQDAQPHYQTIYQRGFSTKHNEAKQTIQAKDAEIEAEREKVQAKEAELTKLREQTPDVDSVRQEYEAKLQAKDQERQAAIDEANTRVETLHRSRFEAELAGALIAARVDPDYAKEVLVPKFRSRIKVESDGSVKFYDEDGATPLAAAAGELSRIAAERIKGTVDKKWITSTADSGGGSTNGTGGSGSSEWDRIRQSARDRNAPAADAESLSKRRSALLPSG